MKVGFPYADIKPPLGSGIRVASVVEYPLSLEVSVVRDARRIAEELSTQEGVDKNGNRN